MQKAGVVVRNESKSAFVPYLEQSFKQQDGRENSQNAKHSFDIDFLEFLTGAVDMTEPQVQEKIAEFTETVASVPKEKLDKKLHDNIEFGYPL